MAERISDADLSSPLPKRERGGEGRGKGCCGTQIFVSGDALPGFRPRATPRDALPELTMGVTAA
jgi:hypothetical protein